VTARRTHRALLTLATAAAVAVLAAACSIGGDSQPRALAVSTTTTEVQSTPSSGEAAAVLYFVRDGKLVPVARSVPDRQLATVLGALMKNPVPVERIEGLGTSIPTGTELKGLRQDGDTVSVDLSKAFENVVGPSRQQAIAQMVMTATEFPDVRSLRFSVDGKPVQVTSPTRGDTATVTACDYESLLPSADEAAEADLDAPTTQRLDVRREGLAKRCPTTTTRS
jgi:spore germination protein GerM